jgi:hypothetical protein
MRSKEELIALLEKAAAEAGDQAVVRLGGQVVRQVQAAKLGNVVVADGNAHAGHS